MSRAISNGIHAACTRLGSATVAEIAAELPQFAKRKITIYACQMASDGRLVVSEGRPRKYSPGRKTGENRAPHSRGWTPEQLQILQRDYLRLGALAVAKAIGRTERSVEERAKKLGIRRPPKKSGPKPKPRAVKVKPVKPAMTVVVHRGRGPAHLPGPPIITEHTRHIVGPSVRRDHYRTNTFSTFG